MVKPERTVTIRDMAGFIENASIEIASQKIGHWIREGILLPKASGERRNAVYPFENIQRLTTLEEAGLLRVGVRPRYAGLRLTLWLKGFSLESKLIKEDVKEALMAVAKEGLANSSDILAKDEKIVNGFSKLFGVDKKDIRKSTLLNEDIVDQVVEEMASRLPPINEAEDRTQSDYVSGMRNGEPQEVIRASHEKRMTTLGDIEPQAVMEGIQSMLSLKLEDLIASLDVMENQSTFPLVGLIVASMLATFHPKPYVLPNTNPKLVNVFIYVAVANLTVLFTLAGETLGEDWFQGLVRYSLSDNWLAEASEALKMVGKDE